jgi:L,D-peptidoglycan transpeptidase YkuD (ErfK/YbiS/YcfS/YnhG family)
VAQVVRKTLTKLTVFSAPGPGRTGRMSAGGTILRVALGRAGIKVDKREGDGATPVGRYRLVRLWRRTDRLRRLPTLLPERPIMEADGWCDDAADYRYNRPVRLPFAGSHERLWRTDGAYDLLIELTHNTKPRVRGRGSAIFIHLAHPDGRPTAGCVALPQPTLRRLLARLGPRTIIDIH